MKEETTVRPVPRDRLPARESSPSPLTVQLLTTSKEFASLEAEWNLVLGQSAAPNIFLTWEWIWTWWEVFGAELRPWILTAREGPGGHLAAVAPFVVRRLPFRDGRCQELSFLGAAVASGDHLDVVARAGDEEAVAARFLDVLQSHRRQWDVIALDRMSSDSRIVQLLRRENARPSMVWDTVCPYARLPTRWEDFLATLGRNGRYNLKRHANKLERDTQGAVEFRQIQSADELPEAMEELFRLHQEIRTARGERGAFHSVTVRRFHHRVAQRFLEKGWLRLYLLKARGRTIAGIYCFHHENTVSFYQTGYDREWGRYSPGAAIMGHAIRRSIEEGAREFDFLRGEEPYKYDWTRTARRDLRLRLATTASGSLLVFAYRVLRTTRNKIRQWRGGGANASDFADSAPPLPAESV